MPRIELTGLDGAGKTTIAKRLAATYGFEYRRVDAFDAAFESRIEPVQVRLGDRAVAAARSAAIAVELLAEAAAEHAPNVVFDRYVESARMFWGVAGAFPLPDDVLDLVPRSDAVVLLDVSVMRARDRAKSSRFSDLAAEARYLERCQEYLHAAAAREGWIVVDAEQALARTAFDVARHLGLDPDALARIHDVPSDDSNLRMTT